MSNGVPSHLPGSEIVTPGLADARAGRLTPEACAIWIAWPRLHRAGLVDESMLSLRIAEPEHVLYGLFQLDGANAFGRYNAFLRRLVSFERALAIRPAGCAE